MISTSFLTHRSTQNLISTITSKVLLLTIKSTMSQNGKLYIHEPTNIKPTLDTQIKKLKNVLSIKSDNSRIISKTES